jgi:putrescine transport system ATP-binding protein
MSLADRGSLCSNAGRVAQVGHAARRSTSIRPRASWRDFIGIANIVALDGGGWLALRPEKIALSAERPALPQTVAGRIVDVAYEGDRSLYHVQTEAHGTMTVSTTNTSRSADAAFARGQSVWLGWADEAGQRLEA